MNPASSDLYDPANAAFLASAAAAAYQTQPALGGFQTTAVASKATDTRVLIASDGEDCVMAFRGTQDLRNWLTDLDCAFVQIGPMRVHRGFFEALESVRDGLMAAFEASDGQRLWLTGHSLGGALAMLCACALGGPVEGVYTFGQPRAGDAAFARYYNRRFGGRTFRVIHANDIVARVPWLLGAYRHAGHEIFFRHPLSGRNERQGAWVQDGGLLTKLPYDLYNAACELRHGELALLDDHHISRYLALFPTGSPESILPAAQSSDHESHTE